MSANDPKRTLETCPKTNFDAGYEDLTPDIHSRWSGTVLTEGGARHGYEIQ